MIATQVAESETAERDTPYVGLRIFTEEDAAIFFGREAERGTLIRNLRAARLTLLYAQSGTGKSSLLRAGVASRLKELARRGLAERGTARNIPVVFSSWRDEPTDELITEIRNRASDFPCPQPSAESPPDEENPPQEKNPPHEENPPRKLQPLEEALEQASKATNATLLVILDQFEEYFLYRSEEVRNGRFADELAACVNRGDLRANFLISIREDAYSGLGDLFQSRIGNVYANYLHLENLTAASARQAIEKPLASYNEGHQDEQPVEIEPALVGAVLGQLKPDQFMLDQGGKGRLDDANGGRPNQDEIAAPYLQLVMERLWEAEVGSGSRRLRLHTLEQLGGAQTIVRTHVDRALSSLPSGDREAAVDILYHLVTPSGTKIALTAADLAEYTGRPVDRATELLERLASTETRILRTVPPPHGKDSGIRYEITHDLLAPAILDWGGRQKAARLEQQKEAAEQRTLVEKRRVRNFRALAVGSLAVLVVASVLAVLAFLNGSAAQTARHQAESRGLAASAEAVLSQNPELAAKRALHALNVAHTPEAQAALRNALPQLQLQATLAAPAPVRSAAFSAGGNQILTAAADGTIRIWDAASHQQLAQFRITGGSLNSAALNRDGTQIVAASDDGAARIIDVPGGQVTRVLQAPDGRALSSAAFSPNGRLIVTAGADGMARLWNAHTGAPLGSPIKVGPVLFDAAFSPDGTRIVTVGSAGGARIWSVRTGQLVGILGSGWQYGASFSPDGKRLVTVSGGNSTVRVWNVVTSQEIGRPIASVSGYEFLSTAFSPDGKQVLAASTGGSARIWDAASGRPVRVLRTTGRGSLETAAFSPDGKSVVTAGSDGVVRGWDESTGRQVFLLRAGGSNQLRCAAFSPDGRLAVTGSRYGIVALWRKTVPKSGSSAWTLVRSMSLPEGDAVNGVAFSRHGKLLAAGTQSGDVFFVEVPSGAYWGALTASRRAVNRVEFDPANPLLVLAASDDGLARIYNWDTLKQVGRSFGSPNWPIHGASFSPDGKLIVTAGNDGYARLWNAANQHQVGNKFGYGNSMNSAVFDGNKKIITTANNAATIIWDVGRGTPQYDSEIIEPGTNIPNDAVASPDGKVIVTGGTDGTAREWDTSDDNLVLSFAGHSGPIQTVAFSGSEVLTASLDGTAKLWDDAPIEQRELIPGPDFRLITASFSPTNGHMVATASSDGTLRVWNTQQKTSVTGLAEPFGTGIESAEFSHSGKLIVTAGGEQAKVYSVSNLQRPIGVLNAAKYSRCSNNPNTTTAASMNSATFSPNDKQVVTSDADGIACIWDVGTVSHPGTFTPVRALIEPAGTSAGVAGVSGVGGSGVRWAVFSPDGSRILTASDDGTARIWAASNGRLLHVMSEPTGEALNSAWFSPDGRLVVTASNDGTARIWSAATGGLLRVLSEPGRSAVYNAAFSHNGRFIVTCSGTDARIWSTRTGQQLTEFQYGTISDCEFSPDGSEVVTAGNDGQARIFSTELATGLARLQGIAERWIRR